MVPAVGRVRVVPVAVGGVPVVTVSGLLAHGASLTTDRPYGKFRCRFSKSRVSAGAAHPVPARLRTISPSGHLHIAGTPLGP
ncbi:hypothetical protein GCM10015535_00830 [Streptomyces gelaticus]|uniref:Uncharacterized protein n=1 Tax=Streptomyces gelaticus TaxID=285446 RepID=A0ABQ2VS79_9ACTN|nr:hypothetical protein GCM10015535_00830 [Streptomyces gelaticus]